MCGYFIYQDYSDHYRFFARFVFIPGLLVFVGGIRATWKHPVFLALATYMLYLLLSGFWSEPLDWYRLGQKTTISIYLLSFIATTHFLVHWNRGLYEGGVIGLGLFLLLLMVAFRNAWSWGRERGEYTVFCILLFAACTMLTDLDTLIERPREQWMLFWFPLALLLAYQGKAPRSGSSENSGIQT